ncbi:ABC transporter ATP-binding protein [Paenibacillus xylanexedens]|uniref:ABC transporter ATP-binding protein n=1 Tax=Paenibacillus xylanexedens TaxID=528191 RepID=UPI003CFC60E0
MNIIYAENLRKTYKVHHKEHGIKGSLKAIFKRQYEEKHAVNGINLEIKEGALMGFIGPNGAGKTTTLKMMSGILVPTGGDLKVLEFSPWKREVNFRRKISIVMGNRSQLLWDLPAMETFELFKEMYAVPINQYSADIKYLAELLDVEHLLKIQVRRLSLGERMKMELIAALIHRPSILFLDEPTIGLDLFAQRNIRDLLKKYNYEFGTTILLTSHYLEDIKQICDSLVVIDKGQIIYDGQTDKIIYSLGLHKFIKVTLTEPLDVLSFRELQDYITTYNEFEITFKIPKNKTNEIISHILQSFHIEDLIIEDPAIEDVIENVYKNGGASKREFQFTKGV